MKIILKTALCLMAAVMLAGCERPPIETVQTGFRGTGMEQIYNPRTPSHTRPPTPTHTPTHTHTHTHTKRARAHTHPPTLPSTPECRRRVKVCTCAVALRGVGGCGGSGVGGGRSGCLRYIRGPPPGSQPRGKVGQLATPVRV